MDKAELIGKYFRVLDAGFVGLVDVMGDDFAIEQAARTSYGKGTRKVSETRGLLRYLMRHRHTTPFEMAELKFHIKVPMDCWRQWIRHRTANVNEYSTRYSEALDDCQKTSPNAWRSQSKSNKQGSDEYIQEWLLLDGEKIALRGTGQRLSFEEKYLHEHAKQVYQERLKCGVSREQARKDLPLSNYTTAFWKIDLHNLLHFLSLRLDSHAQLEIRSYAKIIAGFVKELFPITWEAFEDYRLNSVSLTQKEWKFLQQTNLKILESSDDLTTNKIAKEEFGFGDREISEIIHKLDVLDNKIPRINYSLPIDKILSEEYIK